jgi:ribosome-binding factor A
LIFLVLIMASRRQEKVARIIKEAVSEVIRERLSDPRIEGIVSVTRVTLSADLRNADVYISIYGTDEKKQQLTFLALTGAKKRIQSFVADEIDSKFCPVLRIRQDEAFKKTLETMNIIDQAVRELDEKKQAEEQSE